MYSCSASERQKIKQKLKVYSITVKKSHKHKLFYAHYLIISMQASARVGKKFQIFDVWTNKITNEEVLRHMSKERELLNIIKARKLQYHGHIHKNEKYTVFQNMLRGEIKGKRSARRRKLL